jgi:hypothetical protein
MHEIFAKLGKYSKEIRVGILVFLFLVIMDLIRTLM